MRRCVGSWRFRAFSLVLIDGVQQEWTRQGVCGDLVRASPSICAAVQRRGRHAITNACRITFELDTSVSVGLGRNLWISWTRTQSCLAGPRRCRENIGEIRGFQKMMVQKFFYEFSRPHWQLFNPVSHCRMEHIVQLNASTRTAELLTRNE